MSFDDWIQSLQDDVPVSQETLNEVLSNRLNPTVVSPSVVCVCVCVCVCVFCGVCVCVGCVVWCVVVVV